MIKAANGKIGTREFVSIILLSLGMKLSDTTPNLLYIGGKNAAWMMPIVFLITIGVPFLLVLTLLKKHQTGLIELIFKITGRYIGTALTFSLFLLLFLGVIISSRSYISIVNALFFEQIQVSVLLFLFYLVIYLIAKRGLETISRAAWLIIPLIEVLLIILIVSVLKEMDWMRIFPIAGPGFKQVVKESISHSALYGELILLSAFYTFSRSYKSFRLASFIGFGISCLKLTLFLALYVMVFDYPSTIKMAYPHQQLTRIGELGEAMTHIEGIFFIFWMIASVIRFSIYLYLITFLFAGTIRLEKFEPLLMPFAGLIFMAALLPDNIFIVHPFREHLIIISSWILILLPFLLWAIDWWKGLGKNETSKNSNS